MIDTPKSSRRWFQFHLSTLLFMMFASAGIGRLNTATIDSFKYGFTFEPGDEGKDGWEYGWPRKCVWQYDHESFRIVYPDAVIDALVALSIPIFIAVVLEWLIPMLRGQRPWIKLHRASWMLLALLVIGGIWLNNKQYYVDSGVGDISDWRGFGWPLPMRVWCYYTYPPDPEWLPRSARFEWDGVVLNAATLILTIVCVLFVSEYLLRRRTASN